MQAGPVVNVHMPKDKVTQMHQGYGFVEFRSEIDADYAMKLMNMVRNSYDAVISSCSPSAALLTLCTQPTITLAFPTHAHRHPLGEVIQQTDPSEQSVPGQKEPRDRRQPFYWQSRPRSRREVVVRHFLGLRRHIVHSEGGCISPHSLP